jgi:hypothetical protein
MWIRPLCFGPPWLLFFSMLKQPCQWWLVHVVAKLIPKALIVFAPPLQLTAHEVSWNSNHHRPLMVVVPKFQIQHMHLA